MAEVKHVQSDSELNCIFAKNVDKVDKTLNIFFLVWAEGKLFKWQCELIKSENEQQILKRLNEWGMADKQLTLKMELTI